ncbi:hypothetical protein [Marinobacterium aestuariivivens]
MFDLIESHKGELLRQLCDEFNARLDEAMAQQVNRFARQYYRVTPRAN